MPLLIKLKKQYTANKKQARTIANHFKKQLKKRQTTTSRSTTNTNKIPFSKEDISVVIDQLKNNKSTGRHGIKAELLKFKT